MRIDEVSDHFAPRGGEIPSTDAKAPRARIPSPLLRAGGVYRPQEDTWLLAAALSREPSVAGSTILDFCTGTGALALAAARLGAARVTAVDVSVRAAVSARANAWIHRLPVRVRRGGLSTAVSDGPYDLVLANPPYVPCPTGGIRGSGRCTRWDAGIDGRAVLGPLCRRAGNLLVPGGRILIVQSQFANPERTVAELNCVGLSASVCARVDIPFGPVMRRRTAYLRARGLSAPGQSREELVVVRGRRPTSGADGRQPTC